MTKILITGAAGFIGSHTADVLLTHGNTVHGVDNFRTGKIENLSAALTRSGFAFTEVDVAIPGVIDRLITAVHPAAIIHLAALVSVPESIANPAENDRLNLQATRMVAEAAAKHGVKRIVFASSAAVYGNNQNLPLTERAPCSPLSPYGEAKLASERLLLELSRATGITVRCHRYFNVFGPRQDPSSAYSGVISRFEAALRAGVAVTINGDGEQTRDFIAVADVARANLIAATSPGIASGVANICTGRSISLNTLQATMCRVFERNLPPTYGPARAGDIRHSLGSPELAAQDLGFRTEVSLEQGLRSMLS